jgi:hypothetical protein
VTDRCSGLPERHPDPDVVNRQHEARRVRYDDVVHGFVVAELENLHGVALRSELLLWPLALALQVLGMILLVNVLNVVVFIFDPSANMILTTIK